MTRSKMIKMLQSSVAALTAMEQMGPSVEPADAVVGSQTKVNIMQLILQILEALLEAQTTNDATSADLQLDNSALLHALSDTLSAVHLDLSKSAKPNAAASGVSVSILQLILQIIQAILAQSGSAPAPATASIASSAPVPCPCAKKASAVADAAVARPLLTSDSVTYGYDTLGRLHTLTFLNGTVITYNYDAAGNRTSTVTTCSGTGC